MLLIVSLPCGKSWQLPNACRIKPACSVGIKVSAYLILLQPPAANLQKCHIRVPATHFCSLSISLSMPLSFLAKSCHAIARGRTTTLRTFVQWPKCQQGAAGGPRLSSVALGRCVAITVCVCVCGGEPRPFLYRRQASQWPPKWSSK